MKRCFRPALEPGACAAALMTVLTLVELDGIDPADASLRALTLARSLGDSSIGTVVFADAAAVPTGALADYGVTDAYVIEPGSLEGYAPQAWARARASELNKGGDAARAALAMLRIKRRLAKAS